MASAGARAVAMVAYPSIVFLCLHFLEQRVAMGLIAVLLVPLLVWIAASSRGLRFPVVLQGIVVLSILGTAFLVGKPVILRAVPPLIALSFAMNFLVSILRGRPMVETLARMTKPDLPREEVRYCRNATWYWVGVQILLAALVTAAIFLKEIWQWFVVAAPVPYVIMGVAFAAEYVYRKRRFGDLDPSKPWDRLIGLVIRGRR